jgi:hypothetical protein
MLPVREKAQGQYAHAAVARVLRLPRALGDAATARFRTERSGCADAALGAANASECVWTHVYAEWTERRAWADGTGVYRARMVKHCV